MAGLENQIRSLSLGPGGPGRQYVTASSMASVASRSSVQVSGGGLIHVASPSLLNGRSTSRNDTRSPMVQQQHPGDTWTKSQQHVMVTSQTGNGNVPGLGVAHVSRPSIIRDPQPMPNYLVSKHVSDVSSNEVHRNAIAQQLVQQSLHNKNIQLQRMSQQTRSGQQQQPPPPSYTCSQTMPRVPPHHVSQNMSSQTLQHVRPPGQSPYLYQDQTAVLHHALTSLQNTRTLSKPVSSSGPDQERTYMNVQPVAVVGRNGRVMKPGDGGGGGSTKMIDEGPRNRPPAIPKSQEVKHRQEPLYATILGVVGGGGGEAGPPPMYEDGGMYANYAPASLYSNYSNYSELEMLRSCDSHCSAEEEHTEGLPAVSGGGGVAGGGDSPVSSSYSELRQAGGVVQVPGYNNNMEGDYEPVIPPKGGGTSVLAGLQQKHFKSLSNSSSDSDCLGTCVKCGERIVGEGTGCSAMGRPYHIHCFTCSECNIRLQGLPFYAVDGKPLCQTDYLSTLERCCKCFQPILDRILRATGKPYHPSCFTCVVCTKSLDGIPFTVDAANQIHCIEDFHRRFAPRCSVCRYPIMPTPGQDETVRVVALDRSFHVDCYRCVDCNVLLSSEEEGRGCYPLDNDVLCKGCNTRRIQALTSALKLS